MEKIVLIVDDDRSERRFVSGVLREAIQLSCTEAENGRDALRILKNDSNQNIALVILDLDMPVMGGMETLRYIKASYPHIPVLILTGHKNAEIAVEAIKNGADDFLNKPIDSARLEVSARNALKLSLMSKEISRLKRENDDRHKFSDLIGFDKGLAHSVSIGRKAAGCLLPVLITGETGTGKELFARAIHGEGARAGSKFIAVNCGAIPEKLVESILFGHEKGAFTGATHKAKGKFTEANGGTIFLDEIGELPLDAQVKLLRVLQQQEVEPVGATEAVAINVRIISATNRNLWAEVQAGRFREDLFYRLNVLHVDLPCLRERIDDLEEIAKFFIRQYCLTHQSTEKFLSTAALKKMKAHRWNGNVRELENLLNRAMALSDNLQLEPEDFNFSSLSPEILKPINGQSGFQISCLDSQGDFKSFKALESEIIEHALAHHNYNMTQTARVLRIAKSTLYTKIEIMNSAKSD